MTEVYKLLKTQKNEVFQILQEEGLEPANFYWAEEPSISDSDVFVFCLYYRGSQFYFQFDFFRNLQWRNSNDPKLTTSHYCEFSPGDDVLVKRENPGSWELQKNYVRFWTLYLSREIDAPDLWGEMEKYKTSVSLALPEQLLNEPIPANEAEKISEQLSSLADKIEKQFELTNEQNQFVRSKLNYLAEAAKRQRSMDWAHTLIGVSVTIAMGLALAPDQAKELWELMRMLGELIHLFGP